jgi:phosphoadenosine phosphosulfate reductase
MQSTADNLAAEQADALFSIYQGLDGVELLRPILTQEFRGRIAVVSSFGTESALLLSLVAEIDPNVPVLFLDTGKHFGETLRHRDRLVQRLGLGDVRSIKPDSGSLAEHDPDGVLWASDADTCCRIRKVEPLQWAVSGFDAWITGRKRFQGGIRGDLPTIEASDDKIKVNPLAAWSRAMIDAALAARGLPRHPLEADGFLSIGCMPCTDRVAPGNDARSGRWAGRDKVECGIHLPAATIGRAARLATAAGD